MKIENLSFVNVKSSPNFPEIRREGKRYEGKELIPGGHPIIGIVAREVGTVPNIPEVLLLMSNCRSNRYILQVQTS